MSLSRSVRSRVRRRLHGDAWCNAAVDSLNMLYGSKRVDSEIHSASSAQFQGVERIRADIASFGAPPCSAAEAFFELCGQRAGYEEPVSRATFQRDLVSLPSCGGLIAGEDCLTGQAAKIWKDWKQEIWLPVDTRDPSLPSVEPFSDPALVRRPRAYAEFVLDMLRARLCKLGSLRDPKVGIFSYTRKTSASE